MTIEEDMMFTAELENTPEQVQEEAWQAFTDDFNALENDNNVTYSPLLLIQDTNLNY